MSVELPDMERKLTAILNADVKGYSRLMGDDEAATVRTIHACSGPRTGRPPPEGADVVYGAASLLVAN